jgi:hypothetical protein
LYVFNISFHPFFSFFPISFLIFVITRPNNARITIPTSHILIPTPKEGDIVSFYYETGDPSPKIYRIRTDVNWDDVVYNFYSENQHTKSTLRWRSGEGGSYYNYITLQNL